MTDTQAPRQHHDISIGYATVCALPIGKEIQERYILPGGQILIGRVAAREAVVALDAFIKRQGGLPMRPAKRLAA